MSDVSATANQEPTDQKTEIQVLAENSRSLHEVAVRALKLLDQLTIRGTKERMLTLEKDEGKRDVNNYGRLTLEQAAQQSDEFISFIAGMSDRQVREPFEILANIGATAIRAERDTRELTSQELSQLEDPAKPVMNAIKFLEKFEAASKEHSWTLELLPAEKTAVANMVRVLTEVLEQVEHAKVVDLKAKNADVIKRRENVPIPIGSTIDKAKAALHRERKDYIRELRKTSEANAVRIIPGFEDRLAEKAAIQADYVERVDELLKEEAAGIRSLVAHFKKTFTPNEGSSDKPEGISDTGNDGRLSFEQAAQPKDFIERIDNERKELAANPDESLGR